MARRRVEAASEILPRPSTRFIDRSEDIVCEIIGRSVKKLDVLVLPRRDSGECHFASPSTRVHIGELRTAIVSTSRRVVIRRERQTVPIAQSRTRLPSAESVGTAQVSSDFGRVLASVGSPNRELPMKKPGGEP
jgi:hypothetical protein